MVNSTGCGIVVLSNEARASFKFLAFSSDFSLLYSFSGLISLNSCFISPLPLAQWCNYTHVISFLELSSEALHFFTLYNKSKFIVFQKERKQKEFFSSFSSVEPQGGFCHKYFLSF